MTDYISQEAWLVTASIGTLDLGVFNNSTGADGDADISTIHPGGLAPEVVVPGRSTVADLVCTRPLQAGDIELIRTIWPKRGKAEIHCTRQPLDENGKAWGAPQVFKGLLKGITQPQHDAESTDPARWGITIRPGATLG